MTSFTPRVSQGKLLQLTDFDLWCITRWSPCANESELMPSAWRQYEAELRRNEDREKAFETCEVPLEFFGREYQEIAVAEVLSSPSHFEPTLGGGTWEQSIVRVIRVLKGRTDWPLQSPEDAIAFDRGQGMKGWKVEDLKAGRRYIFLGTFGTNSAGHKEIALDDCGLVPFTSENLAAIQRGIDAAEEKVSTIQPMDSAL
jgi:hypothetical protein